eukprot:COSAG05_NODE_2574_length_2883_cov_2.579023_1_plen_82_part_00
MHIYRHGSKWRILAAGSDGTCMDAANASITPLGLLYESDSLVIGEPDSWRFVSVLYTAPRRRPGAVAVVLATINNLVAEDR